MCRINQLNSLSSFDLLISRAGEEFLDLGAQALLFMQTSFILWVHFSEPLFMQDLLAIFLGVHLAFSVFDILLEESFLLDNGRFNLGGNNGLEIGH